MTCASGALQRRLFHSGERESYRRHLRRPAALGCDTKSLSNVGWPGSGNREVAPEAAATRTEAALPGHR